MSDDLGKIIAEIERDAFERKTITYTWEGPPIARLPKWAVERGPGNGKFIEMGPWLLRVIDEQPWCDVAIVENVDRPFAWAYTLRHRLRNVWKDFTYRMVYTLILWGLAKRPEPGTYIDWHLVKDKWL